MSSADVTECHANHPATVQPRVVAADYDMVFPEVPFPSLRVLAVAGETRLRKLVHYHHRLLRQSEIGHLFATDEARFFKLTERIAGYIVEVCGGPALYSPTHGQVCMRTRHFPLLIDERAREVWLNRLWRAMEETDFPVEAREELWNWLEPFTLRMINRRTTRAQPARFPYTSYASPDFA